MIDYLSVANVKEEDLFGGLVTSCEDVWPSIEKRKHSGKAGNRSPSTPILTFAALTGLPLFHSS